MRRTAFEVAVMAGPAIQCILPCHLPHRVNLPCSTVSTTLYRDILNTRGRHGVYVSPLYILRHSKLNVISTSVPSLYLDPQIRDWVLFPITLVMVCFFFCHYARAYVLGDLRYS